MAQLLQSTEFGYRIINQNNSNIDLIVCSGHPGGDSSFQDAASVNSRAFDVSSLKMYRKGATGNGKKKWEIVPELFQLPVKAIATNEAEDNVGLTTVLNNTVATIDGINTVSFADGDRILFVKATGSQYILTVVGTPGSGASLDVYGSGTNLIAGQIVYVNSVSSLHNKQIWICDGDRWHNIHSTLESRFNNLETIVGDINNGLIHDVDDALDRVDALENVVGDSNDGLVKDVIGLESRLTVIENVTTELPISVNNVTTETVVDSVDVSVIASCNWKIRARDVNGNTQFQEIIGWHNGTKLISPTGDAVFFVNNSGVIGNWISGFDVNVDLDLISNPKLMRLKVVSNNSVSLNLVRNAIEF